MGVSLLLMAVTGLFWFLGMRNADEVIGILEKLMAAVLLVLTLSFGGMHQAICIALLLLALSCGPVCGRISIALGARPRGRPW